MNLKSINKFITGKLVRRIREDADSYRILNERDLESLVYYELRKKLDGYEDVKISTNFTATGISWKRKSGGAGKFIQPDIVILESKDKRAEHKPRMHIAIELKARTPSKSIYQDKSTYKTLFRSRTLQKDFKKLNKLIEERRITTGYFLYLYFDINEESKESKVKKILDDSFPKGRFETIMINKFENPKTKKLYDEYEAEKFRHRSRQLYRFYAGKNDRNLWKKCPTCDEVLPHSNERVQDEHTKKKKKKAGRISGKRSAGGVKAWNTSLILIAKMLPETRKKRGLRMPTKKQLAAAKKQLAAAKRKRN